jgi:di/tricarboxylate transporter
MSWEVLLVAVLLIVTLGSFIWEKISTDVTAITLFAIIIGVSAFSESPKIPTIDELMAVFANPAAITIAMMFVISAALNSCGAIERFSSLLGGLTTMSYRQLVLIIVISVGFISAFINNTPVVVVFVPVVISIAKTMQIPASKLLIPLSYASIFGGCCTLIGTSTNILGSSIIQNAGHDPIGMFELSKVGIPLLLIATIYLVLFANKLIPKRETLTSILSEDEKKEYFTEIFVRFDSDIIGKGLSEIDVLKRGMRVVEIIRNGVALEGDLRKIPLAAGDRIILSCRASGMAQVGMDELHFMSGVEDSHGLEEIAVNQGVIGESVISPTSTLISKTIREINFRQRYRVIVLAIHRHGRNVREKLYTTRLKAGDTLLIMGTNQAIESLRKSGDLVLLDRPLLEVDSSAKKKMPIVLGTIIGIIACASTGIMPIVAASAIGVAILFITGCLKTKEGYDSVEWSILMMIYGMLGLGIMMEKSGASTLFAESIVSVVSHFASPDWQPIIMLAVLYLTTSILTEMLSNNATIVLMAPIALSMSVSLQVDARPFIVAACIAASASFATPIGYQTNTYIYSVGGYRFTDFMKIGLPLNFIYFVSCMVLIPRIWSF